MARSLARLILGVFVCTILSGPAMAADPAPADLCDLASPLGVVDRADVDRLIRIVAGLETASDEDRARADVAPATLRSDESDPYPHRVSPNPAPGADPDIGDIVLCSRRAAGQIEFEGLNASPLVQLQGNGALTNTSPWELRGSVSDDGPLSSCTVEIRVNGTTAAVSPSVGTDGSFLAALALAPGVNLLSARATDGFGRVGPWSESLSVTLDPDAPELTIDSPAEATVFRTSPVLVSGTVRDVSAPVVVTVVGPTGAVQTAQLIEMGTGEWLWGAEVPFVAEGEGLVSVYASDAAGNESERVGVHLIYDITPPFVEFDAAPAITNQATLTLTGRAGDLYGVDSVTINGRSAAYDADEQTFRLEVTIQEGDNRFTAQALDRAGNPSSTAPILIVGDFQPPVLTLRSDSFVNDSAYVWEIGISEPVTLLTINGQPHNVRYAGTSFQIPGWTLENGINSLTLSARDDAGNLVTPTFTVIFDQGLPEIRITRIEREGYLFRPENGVDGVVTNAPTILVHGEARDALSGIAAVEVNGYPATVVGDAFVLGPLPIIPRANLITAKAWDGAGNTAQHVITVHQDVEGPRITLTDFRRAASVSNIGQFNNPSKRQYDGSRNILVHGQTQDVYTEITGLTAAFAGQTIPIQSEDGFLTFSFTLPAPLFDAPALDLLSVVATDGFGNENLDIQSALVGQFAPRGGLLENALGLKLSAQALSWFSTMIADQVEGMDGAEAIDESVSQLGVTIDVEGMAFCDPGSGRRYDDPGPVSVMDPPYCRYYCNQNVDVTMSILSSGSNAGAVSITMVIPYLHVDLYMHGNLVCWGGSEGYAKAQPATITLLANFVDTPDGPSLQSIPGSVNVALSSFSMSFESCGFATWLISLLIGTIQDSMETAFEEQIDSILGSLGSSLAKPIMENANTEFSLYIHHVSNDVSGLTFWLDAHGNPCPDPSRLTDKPDEEGGFKPCPDPDENGRFQDIYDAPGSFLTPNSDDAGRPALTLTDEQGVPRTFQAALNDDFVNYLLFSEWAQGALEMEINQETVGATLRLDTSGFSIFVPELANPARTDIQAVAPTGTPLVIRLHPMLPITVEGLNRENPSPDGLKLRAGDLLLSFWGDPDLDGDFNVWLFDVAVSLTTVADITYHAAPAVSEADYLSVELAEPEIHSDLVGSAFILNENSVRTAVPTLVDFVLPTYEKKFSRIELPGSGTRIAEFSVIDPNAEFVNLVGDLQASIIILEPNGTHLTDLPFNGLVSGLGLVNDQTNAAMELYVGPLDDAGTTPPLTKIASPVLSTTAEPGVLTFMGTIPLSALAEGPNRVRAVVYDANFPDSEGQPRISYATMTIRYAAATGEAVVESGVSESASTNPLDNLGDLSGCLGCRTSENLPNSLLFGVFLIGLLVLLRRVRKAAAAGIFVALILSVAGFGCSGGDAGSGPIDGDGPADGDVDQPFGENDAPDGDGTDDEKEGGDSDGDAETEEEAADPVFTGPEIDDDPVLVLNLVAIGTEEQGFNLDEGRSPEGDAAPDNGLSVLGTLANAQLQDGVNQGSIILLLQFEGLNALPAAGERGTVRLKGYLGQDTDEDPTDNFNGREVFAISPSSFDGEGKLLIDFPRVEVWADENGQARFHGGPALFTLKVPLGEGGDTLDLTITETQVQGNLAPSALRTGGLDLAEGLLGGIIPCAALAQPVEALGGIAPLSLLKKNVDIDLNGDGQLDKRNDPSNEDGISAAVVVGGVPAFLDTGSANRAPVVALDALPESVTEPVLAVTGTLSDPDGNCGNAQVALKVNDLEPSAALVRVSGEACVFEGSVTLQLGLNTLTASATDERGAVGSAGGTTTLSDAVLPVVVVTGPNGTVTSADPVLTGSASDNIGLVGVRVAVENGLVYSITAAELGTDGTFALPIRLPTLGTNHITVTAKDLAENESLPVEHALELADVEPPTVELGSVTTSSAVIPAVSPCVVHEAEAHLSGSLSDNFGADDLAVQVEVASSRTRVPCEYDGLVHTFSCPLALALGSQMATVYARDPSGNEGSAALALTFQDDSLPVILVTAPEPLVHARNQILRFTATDDVDDPSVLLTGVTVGEQPESEAEYDAEGGDFVLPIRLDLGPNAIRIEARDSSGNTGISEGTITLQDINAPVITLTSPEEGETALGSVVHLAGTVSDDIGLDPDSFTVSIDDASLPCALDSDLRFDCELEAGYGELTLSVSVEDESGLLGEVVRHVTRLDPEAPASIELTADPAVVVVEIGESVLSARVLRNGGGTAASGIAVLFDLSPETAGGVTESALTDDEGVATALFQAGSQTGPVQVRARVATTGGELSDTANLQLAAPTSVDVQICFDGSAPFAGASMSLSYRGPAELGAPQADSLTGIGPFSGSPAGNSLETPPRLYLAGTETVEDPQGVGLFAWTIESGVPVREEFEILSPRLSDRLGHLSSHPAFVVCSVEHRLGDLPPLVAFDPLPAVVESPELTVTVRVEDADLTTCAGVLSVNGAEQTVDVTTGIVSAPILLSAGENLLRLTVTDAGGQIGQDQASVRYETPNSAPTLVVTSPGAVTSLSETLVSGTISDDGPLAEATVRARVGGGDWVTAEVDPEAGTFVTSEALPLAMGVNTLRLEARDGRGAVTTLTTNVQRIAPITPPQVSFETPGEGAVLNTNPVTVSGSIAEGGNPAQITVALTLNGQPADVTWNYFSRRFTASLMLEDGENTITVRAVDLTGGWDEETRHVSFLAPDAAPTLSITSPSDGARLAAGEVLVRGIISDDRVLSSLASFTVNGVAVTVDRPAVFSSTWSARVPLTEGENLLAASVTDKRGNTAAASVTVNNVTPPTIILNVVRIGGPAEGFNVDQVGSLGDIGPDNALTGLGSLANAILETQLVNPEKPLLLIFEFTGLASLPGPSDPPVLVTINGYMGQDLDADVNDNFSGQEPFGIKPESYDPETGLPLIRFTDVLVQNDGYGRVFVNTFAAQPSYFTLSIDSGDTPLTIEVRPAYINLTLSSGSDGVRLEESLLGGVVPASNLASPLDMDGQEIIPLQILISQDPSNPIPDVDLNADGHLSNDPATDATPENPDGVSVGIKIGGVPCLIQRQ